MLKLHEALENAFPDSYIREGKYYSSAHKGFIAIEDETLKAKLQVGGVKEYGLNGVQAVEIMEFVQAYVERLNQDFPSFYNEETCKHLEKAIQAQLKRTADRVSRNVEGQEKA